MGFEDLFPEYFQPSLPTLASVQAGTALLVLDTNAWLGFYRLAQATAEEFLDAMAALGPGIWMPHQVAVEYLDNHSSVVRGQIRHHEEAISEVRNLVNKIKARISKGDHPYFSEEDAADVFLASESLIELLGAKKEDVEARFSGFPDVDPIREKIDEIVGEKHGAIPSDEQRSAWMREGKQRFESRIPPGFKDASKAKVDSFPYGDFFIWEQLIMLASASGADLIFVTADYKEDWWSGNSKERLPLPGLIREFRDRTGQAISILALKDFYRALAGLGDAEISGHSIEEADSVATRDPEDPGAAMDAADDSVPAGTVSTEDLAKAIAAMQHAYPRDLAKSIAAMQQAYPRDLAKSIAAMQQAYPRDLAKSISAMKSRFTGDLAKTLQSLGRYNFGGLTARPAPSSDDDGTAVPNDAEE